MKVVSIATNDLRGGAARSAYRLHRGLQSLGIDARMLVRWKQSDDPSVTALDGEWVDEDHRERERSLRQRWVRDNRTDRTDTLFSLGTPSIPLAEHPALRDADIVHLHWVANFLGPTSFAGLAELAAPVVWTLHDEWGYTGGCHYTAGCDQFRSGCCRCPQLREDPLLLVEQLSEERRAAWRLVDLTIAGPSRWITRRAALSRILGGKPTEVIPYGLDTEVFRRPNDAERMALREGLGLADHEFTLAFGVDRFGERRKGYEHLLRALERLGHPVTVLRFGDAAGVERPRQRTVDLGAIDDDARLAAIYGAADCFALPTLEDNSPNGVLESMACGTPVVAYATGGVPEVVEEGVTGFLAPTGDSVALAEAIERAIDRWPARSELSANCRQRIEAEHTLRIQASRYLELYRRLEQAKARESVA